MRTKNRKLAVSAIVGLVLGVLSATRADAPDWNVDPGSFFYSGSITATVCDGDQVIAASGDILGAFVGSECRGVVAARESQLHTYLFWLTVYSNQVTGETVRFKFYDASDDWVFDIADTVIFVADMIYGTMSNPFRMHIAGSITVDAPNGGEQWIVGTAQEIRWSSPGFSSDVKIELSRSGPGGPWTPLFSATADDGSELWTVTGPGSGNCYIRVADAADDAPADMSDAPFTIVSANTAPHAPSSPSPGNGAQGVSTEADLAWNGGDPDAGDSVFYDIYFGQAVHPPLLTTIGPFPATQQRVTCELPSLEEATTYHWSVTARDNQGGSTTGPEWSFTTETGPPADWWDAAWDYRKELSIAQPSDDYQMKIRIFCEDGHDDVAHGVIDCEGHCLADFSDLRFVTGTPAVVLPYWVEEVGVVGGDSYADVWIRTPGTTPIHLYYGNSGATSAGDASATFPYHDHWESDHTNQWVHRVPSENAHCWWENVHSFGGYRALETRAVLSAWAAGQWDVSYYGWAQDKTNNPFNVDHVLVCFSMKYTDGATNSIVRVRLHSRRGTQDGWTDYVSVPRPDASHPLSMSLRYAGDRVVFEWTDLQTGATLANIELADPKCIPEPSAVPYMMSMHVDYGGSIFTWLPATTLRWGSQPVNGHCVLLIDYWYLRKYVEAEPTWESYGDEVGYHSGDVDPGTWGGDLGSGWFLRAPSPFVNGGSVFLDLPEDASVRLAVFDAAGRRVRNLIDGALPQGTHHLFWDGRNEHGEDVGAGVFFLRLSSPQASRTTRIVRVQ